MWYGPLNKTSRFRKKKEVDKKYNTEFAFSNNKHVIIVCVAAASVFEATASLIASF